MPLPPFEWTLTSPAEQKATYLPGILAEWHRGKLLGLEVDSLVIGGEEVSQIALERLNAWISADGAWRCSLLQHHEVERVLRVVLRHGGFTPVGRSSAGRWATGTAFKELLRDGREGVQTHFGF